MHKTGIVLSFCLALLAPCSHGQVSNPATIASEILEKYPALASVNAITLVGNAQRFVAGNRDTGQITMSASKDGAYSTELRLSYSTRLEKTGAFSQRRSCQWSDETNVPQKVNQLDCARYGAWFAPLFSMYSAFGASDGLLTTDLGTSADQGGTVRKLSYRTPLKAGNPRLAEAMSQGTITTSFLDPQTLLSRKIEYLAHADRDLNTVLQVKVVYSDYRVVSGLPIPYQIDRYVNGALELSISISTVSLQ